MSFIDETMPPGYAFTRNDDYSVAGWSTAGQSFDLEESDEAGERVQVTCRSAWRHWTAAVLKGRAVVWAIVPWVRVASIGCVDISTPGGTWPFDVRIWRDAEKDEAVLAAEDVEDIDEAMARFAGLVIASEGMPL